MTADENNSEPETATKADTSAMGIRPSVVPLAAYLGAAINNANNILTDLAPWVYLGTTEILLGITQVVQRRKGKVWDWPVAVAVGFAVRPFTSVPGTNIYKITGKPGKDAANAVPG